MCRNKYTGSRFRPILGARGLPAANLDEITNHLGVSKISENLEEKNLDENLTNQPRPLLFAFLTSYRA
jgi:hypothetical protein